MPDIAEVEEGVTPPVVEIEVGPAVTSPKERVRRAVKEAEKAAECLVCAQRRRKDAERAKRYRGKHRG